MSAYLYQLYIPSKRIAKEFINQNSFVINWAASWVDPVTYKPIGRKISAVCTANEAKNQNDKRILKPLWNMMEQADYLAGHNSDGFDIKGVKWRFMVHHMGFPAESKKVDTFKLSGRETRPPSRGLEYLSLALGGRRKKGLSRDEWIEIVAPDTTKERREKLLRKSDVYCRGDVNEGVMVMREYCKSIEMSGRDVLKLK